VNHTTPNNEITLTSSTSSSFYQLAKACVFRFSRVTCVLQMIPLFDDDRRRRDINLGGHSSSTSQISILNEAKARREERQDYKRRQRNAVRIQAWWRGLREARAVRRELRKTFERDVTGLTGLRCLVLIGRDENALAQWSIAMINAGEGTFNLPVLRQKFNLILSETLLAPATGPDQASWFVLVKRISTLLLKSVANQPESVLFSKCSSTDRLNALEIAERDSSSQNPAYLDVIHNPLSSSRTNWFGFECCYGALPTTRSL
jgi:hypothetical protein